MTTKKVPLRMCIGCGEMKPKRELIRIVRQPDDTVCLDATGKKAGRGAYICPQNDCLQKAKKGRKLEKSFSCRIEDAVYDALTTQLAELEAQSSDHE